MIRWYRFSAILVLAIGFAIAQLLALFTTLQASQELTGVVFLCGATWRANRTLCGLR